MYVTVLGLLLLCASWVVCQRSTVTSSELWSVVDDFWTWRLRTWPEYGTKYGFYEHDDKVEVFTEAEFEQQHKYATGLLERSQAIGELSTQQDRLTLTVLQANLHGFIDGYEFRQHGLFNPLNTVLNDDPLKSWKVLLKWKPLQTETDYRLWLSRLRLFPTQLDQKVALMRQAIASNTTLHSMTVDSFLTALDKDLTILRTTPTQFALFAPFDNFPASFSNRTRQDLLDTVTPMYNTILQSLESLAQFLRNEYRPRCRSLPGVHSLPSGHAYYDACLRWHTSLNLTARQVHDIGLREVDNILAKMRELAGESDLRKYLNVLKNQTENYFETMEEARDFIHRFYERSNAGLTKLVRKVPKMPLGIEINNGTGGASYSDPSLDGSRPGVMNLYFSSPTARPKYTLIPLILHEGVPGHHLQAAYAAERDMPYFRRAIEFRKYHGVPYNWPFHTAYIEGWGLYAESLGEEFHVYDDVPHARLGRYMTDLYRAARLVVDTGIHAFNWTFEQGVAFLTDRTTMSDMGIRHEVARYVAWPGQACAYKLGELVLQDLRREAQTKLNSKFDLRDFHDTILELGPAPLSVLQQHVRDWIAASGGVASSCPSLTVIHSLVAVMLAVKNSLCTYY